MKNKTSVNMLGTLPILDNMVTTLTDTSGRRIYESYIYKIGFFRFNWHPSLEILIVLKGKLKVYTEVGIFEASEKDVILINNNVGHATMTQEADTIAAAIHISSEFITELCGYSPLFSCASTESNRENHLFRAIRSCFANIYLALSAPGCTSNQLHALSQLYLLISILLYDFKKEEIKTPSSTLHQQTKFQNIVKYIGRNFRDTITLSDIAKIAEMNPTYTSVFFKSHIGLGFHEYLTRKRLEYAAYMINNSDDSLLEIALSSGFPDSKSFSNSFKKYFNINPRQYRNLTSSNIDSNVSSHAPIRLTFDDPFITEKLADYDMLHILDNRCQ